MKDSENYIDYNKKTTEEEEEERDHPNLDRWDLACFSPIVLASL